MKNKTAWEESAESEGTTESERILTRLARKAFLSLWSYPNVYSDEGKGDAKGDGKELVDLLVVFGDDVLLFSDKSCRFQSHVDINISWPRWYRRAIDKSARQLAGAESFIKRFPERVFLDKSCAVPLPLTIPNSRVARYHLIAVTRGSHLAAKQFFGGGSSGSLMLSTYLRGRAEHEKMPFHVGQPLENGRFIHVFDEITVNLLLDELDTVPDFIAYLRKKEEFLEQPGVIVSIPGEEDLLARYMATVRNDEHTFPKVGQGVDYVALPEGDWEVYLKSPQRAAKKQADKISYMWDALIEHHSTFIRSGEAISSPYLPSDNSVDHERVLRALAEQPRLARRTLASDLHYALQQSDTGHMFARVKMIGRPPNQAFVFLTIPKTSGEDYATIYRERRMHALTTYCHTVKESMPTLEEAIGIACEPLSEGVSSHDFIYVDLAHMPSEEIAFWRAQADELEILRPKTDMMLFRDPEREFPAPYRFVDSPAMHIGPDGTPMNRAERRKADREARKRTKKAKKR
ncbi:MAG: hypothetical protein CMK46_10895 [Porticoccus sp.]|uniref:hypothetical protein n=1 Tax=Porticoccus hydrocarbonoclasticus TaxID=1073414 RepID=UPI000C6943D5|nr:hypothetical protein [Porticoccus hydrocarbonoclasticus]MBG58773.1 hypothetical protein [Porticoccus sp.]|tara:strand:+ start:8671 stop:10221 length:1551 start_codon:yes stop_codon:yes gene_type:complete